MSESCVMRWVENCLVVELSGEVDHHMAAALRKVLDREIREKAEERTPIYLIFDFSAVTFMGSSGIGVVMGRYNTIRLTGGRVYITGCDSYVERILEMAGVFLITDRRTSSEKALAECLGKAEL